MWARTTADLAFAEFDTATVTFDPLTGETWFLNDLPVLLLETLEQHPLSIDDIIARLAGDLPLQADQREAVLAALHHLEQSELVQSLP